MTILSKLTGLIFVSDFAVAHEVDMCEFRQRVATTLDAGV